MQLHYILVYYRHLLYNNGDFVCTCVQNQFKLFYGLEWPAGLAGGGVENDTVFATAVMPRLPR